MLHATQLHHPQAHPHLPWSYSDNQPPYKATHNNSDYHHTPVAVPFDTKI